MIEFDTTTSLLIAVGKGEAERAEPGQFDARARMTVRYADPAAWTIAAAVARAVDPEREQVFASRDRVGLVVVGESGPQEAMAALEESSRAGFSSPLRFPAANPGSLVGVTCILFGLCGPTSNLIMPTPLGVPVALHLAQGWLRRKHAAYVIIASHAPCVATSLPRARSVLLSAAATEANLGSELRESDVAWLTMPLSIATHF